MAGMTENLDTANLWAPILDLVKGAGLALGVLVVIFVGIQMLAVYAFGANFDIQRWIDRIKVGRVAWRILISILLVVSGIAAELHFAPYLFIDPEQAGPGVLVGLAAIIGGPALLTKNRKKGPPKGLLVLTAVVTVVLVSGCAIGNAVGEVTG